MSIKTILILYLIALSVGTFVIFVPVVPKNIILAPRCTQEGYQTACPLFLVVQHASVSLTYDAFGFGGVLALPSWSYSFHWTQWRYLS